LNSDAWDGFDLPFAKIRLLHKEHPFDFSIRQKALTVIWEKAK